jgi:hypothetical protein
MNRPSRLQCRQLHSGPAAGFSLFFGRDSAQPLTRNRGFAYFLDDDDAAAGPRRLPDPAGAALNGGWRSREEQTIAAVG